MVDSRKFTMKEAIGKGGNGAIFKILCESGENRVLKVEKLSGKASTVEAEFQKNACLFDQSSVPRVYDAWVDDNNHIFTMMELINGQNCHKRSGLRKMKKEEIVGLLVDGIRFFREYNGQKNAHFDIKPENIMIRDGDGKAIFIDFGNAYTESGFNNNPRQNTTISFRSGITHYAEKHKEIIKELTYPWAVHDFIAFLNTILDIANFQYGLGFDHDNWLEWFERGNKEKFWAKMKKDRGCQSVPKEIINLLDLMMSKLPNGYWCGAKGNFSCYYGVEWPSEREVSAMRSEETDKSALIQETMERATQKIEQLQKINDEVLPRFSAEQPVSSEERQQDFLIPMLLLCSISMGYLAYQRIQQMAM